MLVGHDRENFSNTMGEISDVYGEVNLRFRVCIHLFENKQLVMVRVEEIREKYL